MRIRTVVVAFAMTLGTASGAVAQWDVPSPGFEDGVVARVDTAAGVLELQDGRMYRVARGTELVAQRGLVSEIGEPSQLDQLAAGQYVSIRGGEPVAKEGGRYIKTSN
jgi:hypothetical protein